MKKKLLFYLLTTVFFSFYENQKPVLYIIGDSTVKTGKGIGENEMWGWGSLIHQFLDTNRISVENHAIGGRSSRTFLTDGRWEPILEKMNVGDFLFIQFGHNDDWAINDTLRARGTIKGIGEEIEEIDNVITKKHEIVHSFGWYMRKYANEAASKGVKVVICSPVPRNNFGDDRKIVRKEAYYPKWAEEIAQQTQADFVDLHELSALAYENIGTEEVKKRYFTPKDNTHTNYAGALLNAQNVAKGIALLKENELKAFLK